MLTPEYLDGLPDPIVELYAQVEDAILADMARRIVNTDLWTPSTDWQYRKLREAGAASEEIIKQLSKITGKTQAEIRRIMQAAAIESMGYDEGIYETHGMTGEPLASSDALTEILNAGYRATMQTMRNLTRTTAHTASRQFMRVLDKAWMKVQSGAFSTDAAIRSAVNELAGQGVEAIEYDSGRRDTIEGAVRRAVVTGVNQTCGQLQMERAKEMGADLMELTAHEGARPSHAEWQGQIVSLSGQPGYLSLEDIGYGDVAGFKGANCRHDWNPWFEGMPRTWTPEALAKLNEPKYEWDGKKLTEAEARDIQRYNERQIRKWKRVYAAQKAAGQDTSKAAGKISEWNKRQGDFLRATGFKRRQSREEIAGFGLKETRKASEEYAEALKSVANPRESGIINVEADGLTPCLVDNKTGEVLSTSVSRVTDLNDLRGYTKKSGWFINWREMAKTKGVEVYQLVLDRDGSVQGLLAITPQRGFVQLNWAVANPLSQADVVGTTNKQYSGIGGHLFAIAAKKSVELGNGGYLTGFAANKEVEEHYIKEFGARHLGIIHDFQFEIDEEAAVKLLETYNFSWG